MSFLGLCRSLEGRLLSSWGFFKGAVYKSCSRSHNIGSRCEKMSSTWVRSSQTLKAKGKKLFPCWQCNIVFVFWIVNLNSSGILTNVCKEGRSFLSRILAQFFLESNLLNKGGQHCHFFFFYKLKCWMLPPLRFHKMKSWIGTHRSWDDRKKLFTPAWLCNIKGRVWEWFWKIRKMNINVDCELCTRD